MRKKIRKSTHGVDGPASWRLTLDQDLIDTLKGSFPSWFQSTTTTTASNSAASTTTTTLITTPTHNIINNHSNCATQITIDTSSNHHQHHHHHHHHILNHHNRLHHQNNNTLHHLNGNSLLSSSASPASSIASISSTASKKSSSSCSSSSSSSSSSCSSSSSSSSSSTSSSSSSSLSSCNNNNNNSKNNNNNNISINNIKNNSNHTNNKNHNNNNSNNNNNNNSNSNKTIRILNKSAKSKTASAIIKTTKASISPIFSSSSSHSLGGGSSLLATFSSPTSATVELISDSSCNGLLTTTTTRLSGKHFAQTFQDVILLHEAYDDMSEGEQCLNASVLGSSDDGTNSDSYDPRQSPPKAIVDSSPLQPAMDKNKESLKVKLMVRRPHSQLVEQGIIPPLKTSPAIHEQCKQLERAKTSDLLKAKIQQRPNREDLERLHILEEDECHIDPSLAEKQRMLKKARLADQLNSQIQHRPGPLELIKKNILHTEKPIEKIVKEGLVSFKATSEGLLTRPQHPSKYITFEDDSQSSESDTRQTPPRSEENALPASGGDMLQAAAASAGIVTVALTIPTSGGQVVVSSPPLLQTTKTFQSTNTTILQPYVPPPPPLPPSTITPVTTRHSQPNAIQVKQETANLFEELCQSVAGPNAQSPCHGLGNFLPMIPSPLSLGSTTSTLSPLSSVASPTQSLTPRPPPIQSPALQLHVIGAPKSDAPGKDKNRKKSKSKPVSKARTIKFHEYKGPPSAAAKLSSESSVEETSYQLMLEQQNCLLKFLETLNKNQSIIPAAGTASGSVTGAGSAKTVQSTNNGGAGFSSNTTVVPPLSSPAPAMLMTSDGSSNTSSSGGSTFSIITTPRPPPIPSPALSISSSIPPSPATSYAESTCSLSDLTRLEKMKVSDLKMQLKRRNLPVSGPKPQLIERLKPYLPLESMDCASSNVTITSVSTPVSTFSTEVTINATTCPGDAAMEANSSTVPDTPMAMIVNSPRPVEAMDEEQMDIVQQVDSPLPVSLQTVVQQQPQTATIMLSNEDLLREQQRKIDELQRQLQRSQQELQQIRQKQHHQQQHHHQQQQTVTAQLVNAVPTQQITLITTTTAAPQQTLTVLPQQIKKETTTVPTKARQSKSNVTAASVPATNSTAVTGTMTQKMVVKQQLEAKIQKQKQAAAAAAAAQAQVKAQAQAQAQAKAQAQAFAQAQAQAMVQAQPQIRLLTQKTQTVLIPTTTTPYATTVAKIDDPKPTRQKNSHAHTTTATTNTSTIITNQIPLTAKTNTTHHHNNLGLVWNEGNQTIFLVGLNDQHMTAHTIGNISLAGASPATKKLLNGHQRTSSLPSIVFPIRTTTPMHENLIETKPIITQQQFQQLQQQQQQQIHHPQQLIQLDIKPTGLPPPPPPPPQYEEATKQLAAKSHKSVASNLHMPNIKIKEEPNLITTSTQTISKVSNKSKAVIKSEKLTDVLDILIKQGELPESALEPITPVTPLTPGGSNSLMTDMSGNLIFSTDIAAGSGRLVPKLEPQANAEASPSHTSTVVLPMDITPSSQQQQASNDVFQLLSNANAATGRSITTSTSNFIENIDMASPLQPDCHIDAESVAKTLDIFLEQHHHSTPPSSVATPHHQSSPIHHHHDMLAKPASSSSPEKSSLNHSPDDEEKLHHFDEFELLELMSQQLEMDIGDDGNGFAGNGSNSGSCSSLQHNQYHHHVDKGCNSSPVILNGLKRDMNPSLQPSISDLIQQQLNHAGNNNSNSSPTHQISSANSEAAAEAAVLAATGGITDADFDFVDQLNQHQHHQQQHHHHHHEHQQLHHHHHQHNGNNNNHNILHNDGNGSSHDVDDDDVVSHFVSTPMDVCDDFDNPLGSFSFTSLSPDSNINTPPHPFGSGNSGVNGASNGSSTCGMAAVHAANSAQLHHNHHSQSMSEQMSICGTSGGTVSTDSTTDAFSSGDNILDLFNIDDYKMSWGEGDFAV